MKTIRNRIPRLPRPPKPPRVKDNTRAKLKTTLDMWFSRYIRLRDCDKNGIISCISCKTKIPRKKAHNCHYISRSNYKYRRDEENCYAGCVSCNKYRQEEHMRLYTLHMIRKH